jgi:LmbE family N-acetylglucosaminyl deacetylase
VENRYMNHPDHRAVGQATFDAVFPIVSMPLMYPELGEAHKVREVWFNFTKDPPDTFVDISETLELKMESLRQHKSQVDEQTVQMLREWAYTDGRGMLPAESFKVMYLEQRKTEEKTDGHA